MKLFIFVTNLVAFALLAVLCVHALDVSPTWLIFSPVSTQSTYSLPFYSSQRIAVVESDCVDWFSINQSNTQHISLTLPSFIQTGVYNCSLYLYNNTLKSVGAKIRATVNVTNSTLSNYSLDALIINVSNTYFLQMMGQNYALNSLRFYVYTIESREESKDLATTNSNRSLQADIVPKTFIATFDLAGLSSTNITKALIEPYEKIIVCFDSLCQKEGQKISLSMRQENTSLKLSSSNIEIQFFSKNETYITAFIKISNPYKYPVELILRATDTEYIVYEETLEAQPGQTMFVRTILAQRQVLFHVTQNDMVLATKSYNVAVVEKKNNYVLYVLASLLLAMVGVSFMTFFSKKRNTPP